MSFERKEDYEQVGVPTEFIDNNLFLAAVQWGSLRGPYFTRQNILTFQSSLKKDITQKIMVKTKTFEPYKTYPFEYIDRVSANDTAVFSTYNTTELTLETRWAKDELFVQRDLNRISLGTLKWPVVTVRYTMGVKGILQSDFNYHKLFLGVGHILRLGGLGHFHYDVNVGRVFSRVPYPLLEVHMGNESPYYTPRAYNLMNFFEFISDTYFSVRARHYFEGLFTNRIPVMRKLKWRFLVTGNLVYGKVSNKNLSMIPPKHEDRTVPTFYTLQREPYAEVGYGIENIFKIFRVDFFHRLSYLDNAHAKRFGVKFSAQISL